MKVYKFYSDPGHGWLAVKRKELLDLGILGQISPFSYQKGQTVYLEEDRDLSIFMKAKEAKGDRRDLNFKFSVKHTNKRSPIRSYSNFSVG